MTETGVVFIHPAIDVRRMTRIMVSFGAFDKIDVIPHNPIVNIKKGLFVRPYVFVAGVGLEPTVCGSVSLWGNSDL
jgi:hypothetical protein